MSESWALVQLFDYTVHAGPTLTLSLTLTLTLTSLDPQCPLPDKAGRQGILQVHTRRLRLQPGTDLERVARMTPGTCGADLASICNEAAIRTARRAGSEVSDADLDDAVRSFFQGRGVSPQGLAESLVPAWLRGETAGPQPAPAM